MTNVNFNADFPEHRKKKLVETASGPVLEAFLRDFLAFSAEKQSPLDELISGFVSINDHAIQHERQTMNALIAMADAARVMLGQTVLPQDKPSVGPKQTKIVATPVEQAMEEADDPVLTAMIQQEQDGSALEPVEERVVEHTNRKETMTKLGTRLAPP